MIDCLIFSKSRPAQLDLLLRSIQLHARHLYRAILVLYVDDADYRAGYNHCRSLHRDAAIAWWPEHGFEADVRAWLTSGYADDPISFLVDDDVFYRPASQPSSLPFSYRGGDYDYPFSVDGNVYRRSDIEALLIGLHFRNPSELEAFGHVHRGRLPFGEVNPCQPPCLVGLPLNRVSASSGMPHLGVDPGEMNDAFLWGRRLLIPSIAADVGAHANIIPEWSFTPVAA